MPKRRANAPDVPCPEELLDAMEADFADIADSACAEATVRTEADRKALRVKMVEMQRSVFETIRGAVRLVDDPAAEAKPQPLSRETLAEIQLLERRAGELTTRVKRLRSSVPDEVRAAAERAADHALAELSANVDDTDDTVPGDDTDAVLSDALERAQRAEASTASLSAAFAAADSALRAHSDRSEAVLRALEMESSLRAAGPAHPSSTASTTTSLTSTTTSSARTALTRG